MLSQPPSTSDVSYQVFQPVLDYYGMPLLSGLFALLLFVQYKRPLRNWTLPILRRAATNFVVAIPALLVLRLALIPAVVAAGYWAQSKEFGPLNQLDPPGWLHAAAAFLLLDYSLYLWHILNHKIPFLWRFHNVHHTDLDLAVSTALRFHFVEMFLGVFFRAAAVLLIGAGPGVILVYEIAFQASVAFHHSNLRLPFWLERPLNIVIVTPRMHGIHHSIVHRETDSNYSNMFTVWDRLHRTIRLNIPQRELTIGVPAYRDASELSWLDLLTMPFGPQRDYWQLPDGRRPEREETGERQEMKP